MVVGGVDELRRNTIEESAMEIVIEKRATNPEKVRAKEIGRGNYFVQSIAGSLCRMINESTRNIGRLFFVKELESWDELHEIDEDLLVIACHPDGTLLEPAAEKAVKVGDMRLNSFFTHGESLFLVCSHTMNDGTGIAKVGGDGVVHSVQPNECKGTPCTIQQITVVEGLADGEGA